ncbi:MAG TPA: patatin-like phospholipase family protein [Candidatus Margulisiibacteriota bacterium]|nr:patatin-like phospholipase family protein [Candidatus Margulisiibacteriota bacterium]
MLGLVLTAGGARGAYQAGVLKRIGELPAFRRSRSPFRIIAGASAGAINGATLAAMSGDFYAATRLLAQMWSELRVPHVYRTDALSLSVNGLRILQDLLFGGFVGGAGVQSLLNAAPLRAFLQERLPLAGISESIRKGHLYAIAVTATSYHSGKSFTFIQGQPGHPVWRKARRVALPAELTLDHILASAAIPIVFQPVRLRSAAGEFWFGDGGLRLVTPLSPAIRLGASKLFAVGIRCQRSADDLSQTELLGSGDGKPVMPQPPLSQICGVFLNAIFLDHLDTDLDHLKRMNELILAHASAVAPATNNGPTPSEPMRIVESFVVNPSEDLAIVARHLSHRMPRLVRYLLDGLGRPDAQSADLMSYLLFDSRYTSALVDIGYRDAGARIDAIEDFLGREAFTSTLPARGRLRALRATSDTK